MSDLARLVNFSYPMLGLRFESQLAPKSVVPTERLSVCTQAAFPLLPQSPQVAGRGILRIPTPPAQQSPGLRPPARTRGRAAPASGVCSRGPGGRSQHWSHSRVQQHWAWAPSWTPSLPSSLSSWASLQRQSVGPAQDNPCFWKKGPGLHP